MYVISYHHPRIIIIPDPASASPLRNCLYIAAVPRSDMNTSLQKITLLEESVRDSLSPTYLTFLPFEISLEATHVSPEK